MAVLSQFLRKPAYLVALAVFVRGGIVAASETRDLPGGLVYLVDIDPSILQDIMYGGSDNFIGHPLPGYGAAECILRRPVADALRLVQQDLAPSKLSLKVYDCYRPAHAVRAMAEWASNGKPSETSKRFFPRLDKSRLFALGY